jgi:diguanylate cyclase (GGDEF)-like protein
MAIEVHRYGSLRVRLLLVGFVCMHLPLLGLVALTQFGSPPSSWSLLAAAFAVTLLGTALLLVTVHRAVRPLEHASAALERFTQSGTPTALPAVGHDELATLARQINAMRAELTEQRATLLREATTDALTGLLNRRSAVRCLERLADASAPHWLALSDADRFKAINDTHGHVAGDAVLAHIGRVLADGVPAGSVCARWGGEEFLLVVSDEQDPLAVLNAIQAAVQASYPAYGPPSLSFGVARLGADPSDALRRADRALYRAKSHGGACTALDQGFHEGRLGQLVRLATSTPPQGQPRTTACLRTGALLHHLRSG